MDTLRKPTTYVRRKRAIRLIGALSIGLVAASFIPSPAGGQTAPEDFVRGSGQSYAQIYRVGPTAGRLSLAPIFGLSLADYLNTVGRGETKVADWAGIGVAARELPDNTPALKISSTQEGSEEGKTEVVAGQSDGTTGGGFAEMFARATDAPLGESRFRMNNLSIPGLLEMRDSQSHSKTGIVKAGLREATATTVIGSVTIGGTVVLRGLRWEAVQQTGAKETVTGKFTIEGASVGGTPLPLPAGGSELAPILDPINAAIAPTGFALSPPKVEKRSGQAFVTPLSLDVANSPLGRQHLAPLLGSDAVRDVREPTADAFIQLAKDLEAGGFPADLTVGVLAADLTIGIFSGSSQLHIEMGGVSSYTEGELFESPFGKINFNPPKVGGPQTVFTPGTPGAPAIPGTAVSDEEGTLVAAAPTAPGQRTVPGDKGGVALAVGLIGLAVAAGLAVADWYRIRKSRRAAAVA